MSAPMLKRFLDDASGSTVVMFALALIPALGLIGAALDYSRAGQTRAKLQNGADAAALAGALAAKNKQGDAVDMARRAFAANTAGVSLENASDRLIVKDGVYRFEASGKLRNKLLDFGSGGTDISVVAAAAYGNDVASPLEITFVFDTTNSMSMGVAWSTAVQAVKDTLETLKGNQGSDDFFVTLVPFSDRVRIGNRFSNWLSTNPTPAGWNGCVEPREEKEAGTIWGLSDDGPVGNRRFSPSMSGHYIANHIGSPNGAPFCPSTPIIGPTHDIEQIKTGLEAMQPGGTGRYDEAIAWGWRTLSENWRGKWDVPNYPAKKDKRRKVVVFMSDGHTTAYDREVGGASGKSYGWNMGTELGFQHFLNICTKIKAQGIEVFTFWTGGNDNFSGFMRKCATSEENHYAHVYNAPSFKAALDKISGGTDKLSSTQVRLIQ